VSLSARIAAFSDDLARTPLSVTLQETSWIVPTVQTVHILSVALVIGSSTFMALHALGWSAADLSGQQVARRFLPWLWWALPILLLSGGLLIVAEPSRSLLNPAFYTKLGLLLTASALTLAYELPLRRDQAFWQASPGRAIATKLLSVGALVLWVGVIFAGRWIAYVD